MDDAPKMHDLPGIGDDRLKPCAGCAQPLGITFWMVKPVRCIVDHESAQQVSGIITMLGNGHIARAFAAAPLAREFDALPELCVCETCACSVPLAELSLKAGQS